MALASADLHLLLQAAGTDPVDPTATDQELAAALASALVKDFPVFHPGHVLPPGNTDFGYYAPYVSTLPAALPKSMVVQIRTDFQNWGLTEAAVGAPKQIARTVVLGLVARGGQVGHSVGLADGGVRWLCYAGLVNSHDVVYAFAASGA